MASATPDQSKNLAAYVWEALLGTQHNDPRSPFRSLIEQALPDALFVHDGDGRFMEVNQRACESVGYTRAELLNLSVFDIEQDFDLPAARAEWDAMQPGVRKVIVGTHRRRDGSLFPVEVHFGVLDANGQRCFLCIACDISERVHSQRMLLEREAQLMRALEAAEAANAAKSAFLSNMSHEFRTPLHAIVGMADLIRREGSLSAKQREWMGTLDASCRRLEGMVQSVLELSRMESGQWPAVADVLHLPDFVERQRARVEVDVGARPIEVRSEVDPALPRLSANVRMAERAFALLADNAVKFTGQGRITLRARVERDETRSSEGASDEAGSVVLRLEVEDTGIGIVRETLSTLFTPFTQGDASTTRKAGGMGLGLITVRRIAQLLGGDVGVRSTPGIGSTFWFTARAQRIADSV